MLSCKLGVRKIVTFTKEKISINYFIANNVIVTKINILLAFDNDSNFVTLLFICRHF